MRPDCPVVDRRARGNRFDMDKVKRGVVRRIAVQVKQRQRGDAHGTSIFHLTCETTARRDFSNEKPRLAGGAFLISSLRVSDPAADRPADHPVGRASRAGRLAAAGRASAVRPFGRLAVGHLAAVGRASGLDFDSFYYPLQNSSSAAHARAHGKKQRATRGFCSVCEPFQSIWNLRLAGVFPLTKRRTDDGTLRVAVVAWDSDPDSGADLVVRRSALASLDGGSRQGALSRPPPQRSRSAPRLVRLSFHSLRLNNTRQSRRCRCGYALLILSCRGDCSSAGIAEGAGDGSFPPAAY